MRWRTANNHRRSKGGKSHGSTYGGTSIDEFMEEMWKKFRHRKDLVIVTYIPGEKTDGQV